MKSDRGDVELRFINGTKKTADSAMVGHSLEDKEKFSSGGKSWRTAWVDFTQNTTLHGLRYICLPGAIFRRFVWFLLVATCMCLMLYQILDRIIYYCEWPVTVNVKVNYNKTLSFPAITICNQNAFRATVANELGRYRLLEELYTSPNTDKLTLVRRHGTENITLDELFLPAAHRKEDMIVHCSWGMQECSSENFTTSFTDHGVCYTFNDISSRYPLTVNSTGADHGLKLTLNVEQYEYMPGPHDAAGLKVLFHDKKEFPKVHELGLAIPIASHAFIGLQIILLSNLPAPRGDCSSRDLHYFTRYSADACDLDCFTNHMAKRCGCRHLYMPNIDGYPPVCTLKQYYSCFMNSVDSLYHQSKRECGCPLPCDYLVFDPSVSYASTSPFAADKLRVIIESEDLKRKFLYAKETTHRMERRQFEHTASLINDVNGKLESLRSLLLTEIAERLRSQLNATNFVHDELHGIWSKIDYLYRYQEYNIKRNFVRVRDAMAERTFGHVAIGFPALAHWINLTLRSMASYNVNQSCQKESVNTMLINEIDSRIEMAYQTIQNYTQLYDSFRNGMPIFRYKFGGNPRSANWHIVPRPLLLSALNHTSAARKHSARLGKDIIDFIKYLKVYKEISETVMTNNTFNETYLHLNEVQFLRAGRRYYHSWSIFNSDVIDWPQTVLEQRRQDVRDIWNQYSLVLDEIQDSITNLQRSLYDIRHTIIDRLTEGCSQALAYIHAANATKLTAAETLTSPAIHEGINTMKVFFQEVRHRGQVVFDGWLKLGELAKELWNRVIFDENMFEYYMHTNNTEFTQNFSVVSIDINVSYMCYRDNNDLRFLLGNKDRVFLKSLYDVMAEMSSYKEETKLGSTFLQDNFLQLDVFYRELSYEQINQQVAYDIFSLLCDIGGSMGLFIGASVITMFELMDLIVNQSLRQFIKR